MKSSGCVGSPCGREGIRFWEESQQVFSNLWVFLGRQSITPQPMEGVYVPSIHPAPAARNRAILIPWVPFSAAAALSRGELTEQDQSQFSS